MISGLHLATALSVMLHMEKEGNGMEASKRNLNAYYFGFDETGEDCVDAILEAVADAGHSSHHTESWSDGELGGSLADEIQRSAQKAADRLSEQQQVIDELFAVLTYVRNRIEKSEEWWMDCPDRGGFDTDIIDLSLSRAKGHTKEAE